MLYTSNSFANNQLVYRKLPFDVMRDFAPITDVAKLPGYLILVNTQVPVRTLKELIELSKTASPPLRYGSGGIGNSQHLLGEIFNNRSGAKRWAVMPEVPTVSETVPGFVFEAAWHGMFAPAGTPAAIVARIQSEVAKAAQVPRLREFYEAGGYVMVADTPAEFRAFLKRYFSDTTEHMRIAKVQPE